MLDILSIIIMQVINHRLHGHYRSGHNSKPRTILIAIAGVVGLFIAGNILVGLLYIGKALPNYAVGSFAIGGQKYSAIEGALHSSLLPAEVTLTKDQTTQKVRIADLGITVDKAKTMAAVKHKPVLPLLALVQHHTIPLVLQSDQKRVVSELVPYDSTFSKAATSKHVAFNGQSFVSENAQPGYTFDEDATATAVVRGLADGRRSIAVVVKKQPAGDNSGDVSNEIAALQKQLQTKITLNYQQQKTQPSAKDIGSWYVASGTTMTPSAEKIGAYIDATAQGFGVSAANRGDLVTAITYVLRKNIASNFRISATGSSTVRSYCTAVNGVPESELEDLIGKLASTYADTRGWNDNGAIAFNHVETGCGYTVVIAAPSKMTSYGAICDDYYNCQVGNSVIVNGDRWNYATDPWNKTGQSVEAYRQLIINHETGHRLGFRDTNVCSGPGQPAPVMSQQSIDLLGCTFNVWPLQSELDILKTML